MLLRRWITSLFSCEAEENIHAGETHKTGENAHAQGTERVCGKEGERGLLEGGREGIASGRDWWVGGLEGWWEGGREGWWERERGKGKSGVRRGKEKGGW